MYLNHYQLTKEPFKITCDPEFIWFSNKHKEALADLQYGLRGNRGFVLLTGEVGTGKTLLVNKLLTMLPEKTIAASLSGHNLNSIDFCRLLADRVRLPYTFNSKSEFLLEFQNYLLESNADGQRVVMILDEAQVFGHQVLEDILMLSNIEFPDKKLISIFLVGQPELNQTLLKRENRALVQRITARHHLHPLNEDETASYISHRLKIAGRSKAIFNKAALKKIFECTGGIPRLINIICDRALLAGSAQKLKRVDAEIVAACAQKLRIPEFKSELPPPQTQDRDISRAGMPPNRRRFTKFVYACIIPGIIVSLTLAFLKFDIKSSMAKIKSDSHATVLMRPVTVPDREEKKSRALGLPEDKKISIQFNQANQISKASNDAINRVALQLIEFPEQAIALSSCAVETGSFKQRRFLMRERIESLRSMLLEKGACSYQIKLIDMEPQAMEAAQKDNAKQCALIEIYQNHHSASYNLDK